MKLTKTVLKELENWGFKIDIEEDDITFNQCSPAGQDFSFTVKMGNSYSELSENIHDYYESFDVSSETMRRLNSNGHGINGTPYNMKDAYEDMEACELMIFKAHSIIQTHVYLLNERKIHDRFIKD